MSINKNNSRDDEYLISKYIKMISELYDAEVFINNILINNKNTKNLSFSLFDKDWLEQWKSIVKYDTIKKDCKEFRKTKENKKELYDYIKNLNIEQKLKTLGKMDCSNLNENSNFIPIIDVYSINFSNYINKIYTVKGEISNGLIFIYEPIFYKKSKNNLILLYKDKNESNEFNKVIITLSKDVLIKNMIKELKGKNIEEIIDAENNKIETIHLINNSNKDNKSSTNQVDNNEINKIKKIIEEGEGEEVEEEREKEEVDSKEDEKNIIELDEIKSNINEKNIKEKYNKEDEKEESIEEEIRKREKEKEQIKQENVEEMKIKEDKKEDKKEEEEKEKKIKNVIEKNNVMAKSQNINIDNSFNNLDNESYLTSIFKFDEKRKY